MLAKAFKVAASFLWSAIPPMSSFYWEIHWFNCSSAYFRNHLRGQYGVVHALYAGLCCFFATVGGFLWGIVAGIYHAPRLAKEAYQDDLSIE